jgi:multidrug efflux pump
MKLADLCIKRPVFASVLSLILVIIGVLGYLELPVRFAPQYSKPALSVEVDVPGASAEYMEQNIAEPLELALSGTPGLDYMGSRSNPGQTTIFLNFKNLTTQEFSTAQSQVLQEVTSVSLPQNAMRPQIYQRGDNKPIMMLGINDPNMPIVELTSYVTNYIVPQLEQVYGVANVMVDSGTPSLRIDLNPDAMASFRTGVTDVQNAINGSNSSYPLGAVNTNQQTVQVNSQMDINTLQGFDNIVVAKRGQRLVHLQDIAKTSVGWESVTPWYEYVNGAPGIAIEIDAMDSANPIEVGQGIYKRLDALAPNLPLGLNITHSFDISGPLNQAIHDVYLTIAIAILLVILVTLSFLGTWRSTLIPVVTIPVCLVASFGVMYLFGFSINVMTLLALVLAVGMVVDDAIVVLENTYRHIEAGLKPFAAATKSIHEISFAVLGITICLVAVYVPAIFMSPSIDTVYFQEFSFTLAGAILISGFLALSLSPMMCSRLLTEHRPSAYEQRLQRITASGVAAYTKALDWVLMHRKTVFGVMLANIVFGVWFFHMLPTALLPKSELNYVWGSLSGPNSAGDVYLNQQTQPLREKLQKDPRLSSILFWIYQGQVNFFAGIKKASDRDAIASEINQDISQSPIISGGAMVVDANQGGTNRQGSLFFYVSGLVSYKDIADAATLLQTKLQNTGVITTVANNIGFNQQQYNVEINRPLVTELGIDLGALNNTLSTFFGGYTFSNTTYQVGGYGYPIILQLPPEDLTDLSALEKIKVENSQGRMIPLANLVTVTSQIDLASRVRVNQMRAGEVDVNLSPDASVGQAVAQITRTADQVLPHNLKISWGGQVRDMLQNSTSGNLFIVLGLVFIYLILAAVFESFLDPLIILCTVPLCMVAALIALYWTGGSVNIYTKIALVTLIGLVSKHGVLITQFANQRLLEGKTVLESVREAAIIRLRPILMTTLTMVLGALPLILTLGTDANGRRQIGVVIVFGLLFGTMFSLFIVPVAYVLMARFKQGIAKAPFIKS